MSKLKTNVLVGLSAAGLFTLAQMLKPILNDSFAETQRVDTLETKVYNLELTHTRDASIINTQLTNIKEQQSEMTSMLHDILMEVRHESRN